jgi:hypothetical protein
MSDTPVDMAKVTQMIDAGWVVSLSRGGVKLETRRIGRRLMTTAQAVGRFVVAGGQGTGTGERGPGTGGRARPETPTPKPERSRADVRAELDSRLASKASRRGVGRRSRGEVR